MTGSMSSNSLEEKITELERQIRALEGFCWGLLFFLLIALYYLVKNDLTLAKSIHSNAVYYIPLPSFK